MARRAGSLVLLLVLAACGTTSGSRRATSDILTRAEIETSSASNAYDLLQQLRPQFLRSRGATSIRDPRPAYAVVYMNDVLYGNLVSLRSILVEEIDEVRYISATNATTRWGTGHAAGVIQVRANY
jgi:hypothetical protein